MTSPHEDLYRLTYDAMSVTVASIGVILTIVASAFVLSGFLTPMGHNHLRNAKSAPNPVADLHKQEASPHV